MKQPLLWLNLAQTVCLLMLAGAFVYRSRHPAVLVYDPSRQLAQVMEADRAESLHVLMRDGLLRAARMATGSWPYDPHAPGDTELGGLDQTFSPAAAETVRAVREELAVYQPHGSPRLVYGGDPAETVQLREGQGGLLMEGVFHQIVASEAGGERVRLFLVKASAMLAPVTPGNPYQLKFTRFWIKPLTPKKPLGDTP